jgi:hypothetical protein
VFISRRFWYYGPNRKVTNDELEKTRNRPWHNFGAIPEFFWMDSRKTMKTIRIGGMPAKIRTDNPLNTNLERHHYTKLFGHSVLFNAAALTDRNDILVQPIMVGLLA